MDVCRYPRLSTTKSRTHLRLAIFRAGLPALRVAGAVVRQDVGAQIVVGECAAQAGSSNATAANILPPIFLGLLVVS